MTREQITAKLDEASKILGEYFDAFQIMAAWNEEERTHRKFVGGGNWYARQGMAIEFVEQNKAQMNASEIASKLEPPPDDAESRKKAYPGVPTLGKSHADQTPQRTAPQQNPRMTSG